MGYSPLRSACGVDRTGRLNRRERRLMAATPDSIPDSYIGARLTRPDGPPKVTGEARYAADLSLPGTLHVRLVLSPYAHARVVSVEKQAALELPGVVTVLTAD